MAADRRIRARDIVRDLRSGMSDAELMEKYRVSAKGLQGLFKQLFAARIMSPDELYDRSPSYDHTVVLENLRTTQRHTLFVPVPAHLRDRPDVKGTVREITERGLRTAGLEVTAHVSYTLVLSLDGLVSLPDVIIEATCRWTNIEIEENTPIAGFEITKLLEGDLAGLLEAVSAVPFSHADGDDRDEDEDESTETVDLAHMFTTDVSSSGSFNIRGVTRTWFGKLLQALPLPALLIDRSYRVAFLNQAWSNPCTDYTQALGKPLSALIPDHDEAKETLVLAERVFSARKSLSGHAVLQIGEDKIWGRIHLRSVRMGMSRSILMLVEDLTHEREQLLLKQLHNEQLMTEMAERRKAEHALLQSERLKAVGELASGVSHNFNNLIQIVLGNAQLALINLETGDYASVKSSVEQIVESSHLASGTVRRLQDFALAQPGQSQSKGTFFDFSRMVKQACAMSQIWWKTIPEKAGAVVDLVQDLAAGCKVSGKEHELFEVVVNLIKNAAEALPGGGQILVETAREDGEVVLRVSDTGMGIEPDNLAKVFEPFFSTKHGHGAGMGLASSFGIVSRHSGTISVVSEPGTGTTFTVRFPSVGEVAPDVPVREPPIGLHKRILVIDDMQPITALLATGLAEYGQTVYTALSGADGLHVLEEHPVDVVICDLGMPGMNGWDVAATIKDLCTEKSIPKPCFIILTGWNDQAEADDKMAASGVDVVIQKPVDVANLLQIIRDLVQGPVC
jgi:signal transduction histidine kinase/ActR/RegA family two-component response regulator